MKILVVGSGGREHALAWKIKQSPLCEELFCAPGNPGTAALGTNVPLADSDIKGLAAFAEKEGIGLTVVGPEVPLTLGIVDEFESRGLRIFGPRKKAAELEGSKIFAKQFMERHKIPTGRFRIADGHEQALRIIRSGEFGLPARHQGRRPGRRQGRRRLPEPEEGRGDGRGDDGPEEVRRRGQARPHRGIPPRPRGVLHRHLRRGPGPAPGDGHGPQGRLRRGQGAEHRRDGGHLPVAVHDRGALRDHHGRASSSRR